jgi:glycogen synthase
MRSKKFPFYFSDMLLRVFYYPVSVLGLFAFFSFFNLEKIYANPLPSKLRVLVVSAEHKGDHESGGLGAMVKFYLQALNEREDTTADLLSIYYMSYYDNPELQSKLQKTDESYLAFLNFSYDFANNELRPADFSTRFTVYSRPLSTLTKKGNAIYLRHDNAWGSPNYFDNRVRPSERKRYTVKSDNEYETKDLESMAFGAVNIAMAEYIRRHASEYDLVIFNDWHTGLIPYFLYNPSSPQRNWQQKYGYKDSIQEPLPPSLFIIHNAAHQGYHDSSFVERLGMSQSDYLEERIQKNGNVNSMWSALQYSTVSRTVSRTHAEEIRNYPRLGRGLQGLVNDLNSKGRWTGGINGIPKNEYDPKYANHVLRQAGLPELDENESWFRRKQKGKLQLQKYFGLQENQEAAVFVMTARLDRQKGFEFLLDAVERVLKSNVDSSSLRAPAQFVFIGDGEASYRDRLLSLAKKDEYKGRISWCPWSEEREKMALYFGSFVLAPSIDEPSGQVHLFGKAVGTPFVGTYVGGPVESVVEGKSGFFAGYGITWDYGGEVTDNGYCSDELFKAIARALSAYSDPETMEKLVQSTLNDAENFYWEKLIGKERVLLEYLVRRGLNFDNKSSPRFEQGVPNYSQLWESLENH